MGLCFLFVLLAHSLPGLLAGVPVEVTPERVILLENRPLEVRCRVREPIAYCRFSVRGVSDALSLRPGLPPHEGIQYLGAGLDKGECGMLIQRVSSKHSGIIQCSMGFTNEATESTGNMTLIVARPPDPPLLHVYPGVTYRDAFKEGDTILVNCRISNARPVANISWYLGSEPIYDRLGPAVTEEENGLLSISQNLTRKVTYADHAKDLKCVAGHIALGQGNINHSIYKLNVRFPPKPKSQELEKFGFTIGQPGKIVVTFQANPIPDIVWKVDQDHLKQGTRDRTGRFEAGILQHRGAGTWDAVLTINTVRAEEVEKRYTLIAQNELGHESYKVAISTSPEPPADITAGTIAGIVIAVLVILLLVFILIFARATGRWCFAGGVPRPPGESLPSKRWLFGKGAPRTPQKVNSLVYKDYTLVQYEDGRKSYVSPEEKSQVLLERKFQGLSDSVEMKSEDEKAPRRPTPPPRDSGSDSEYEVPLTHLREKPKSLEGLESTPAIPVFKRNSSCPDIESPGDNGRINLPPYIVPVETSLTLAMRKEKRKGKKKGSRRTHTETVDSGTTSDGEDDQERRRFSLPWTRDKGGSSPAASLPRRSRKAAKDTNCESPRAGRESDDEEEGRTADSGDDDKREPEEGDSSQASEARGGVAPQGKFPLDEEVGEGRGHKERASYGFPLPRLPEEVPGKKKRATKSLDPNPLRNMFGGRGARRVPGGLKAEARTPGPSEEGRPGGAESDTESADHGSADKSSVSKLTAEKQPKKLVSSLLGSLKKGKNRDRVADNDAAKNSSCFEITVKEHSDEPGPPETPRTEGIVYAELDMARSPGSVMRRDDEKTEYAEIIYPGTKASLERAAEELRRSRDNLSSSREDLAEADEAFAAAAAAEGKKEAAV